MLHYRHSAFVLIVKAALFYSPILWSKYATKINDFVNRAIAQSFSIIMSNVCRLF